MPPGSKIYPNWNFWFENMVPSGSTVRQCFRRRRSGYDCDGMSLVLPDGICIVKPKIQIWVNFGGSCNGRCWYISCPFGIFYVRLLYFVAIWYILWPFGIFYGHSVHFLPFWYIVWRKIWQPWLRRHESSSAQHFFTIAPEFLRSIDAGWPDEFCEKIAQNVAQRIVLVKINE
jgi:hypothetical protein